MGASRGSVQQWDVVARTQRWAGWMARLSDFVAANLMLLPCPGTLARPLRTAGVPAHHQLNDFTVELGGAKAFRCEHDEG